MQWREMRRIEQPALTAKSFHWKMIHEYFNVIHLEPKNNSKGSKITTKMSFYVQVWIMNHFFDPPCKIYIGDNFFESFDFLSRRAEHYWCTLAPIGGKNNQCHFGDSRPKGIQGVFFLGRPIYVLTFGAGQQINPCHGTVALVRMAPLVMLVWGLW